MKLVLEENNTEEYVVMFGGKNYIKITSPTTAEVFIYRPGKPPVGIGISVYKNQVGFENYDTNELIYLPWSGKLFTEDRAQTVKKIANLVNKLFLKSTPMGTRYEDITTIPINGKMANVGIIDETKGFILYGKRNDYDSPKITVFKIGNKLVLKNKQGKIVCEVPFYGNILKNKEKFYDAVVGLAEKADLKESILSGVDKKWTYDELADLERKLWDFLKKKGATNISFDGTFIPDRTNRTDVILDGYLSGDWKHEHLYFKDLIDEFAEENGLIVVNKFSEVTRDDGSDFYEAHYEIPMILKSEKSQKTLSDFRKFFGESKKISKKSCINNKKNESVNYYDGETRLSPVEKKFLNSICFRYCGWKEPKEIRGLWEELLEQGIDVGIISGYPDSVAPDGGKSWTVTFSKDDKLVINSKFIYQVYEPADGSKNEYNIYFS